MVEGSEPTRADSSWAKSLVVVAAFMVVLAFAATAAVMIVGGPKEATYAAGSPEAAFQMFVKAARSGDWTTANGLLSANLEAQGLDARGAAGYANLDHVTVSIISSSTSGNSATLNVDYRYDSGSGLGSYSYDTPSNVRMIFETGGWKLDSQVGGGY